MALTSNKKTLALSVIGVLSLVVGWSTLSNGKAPDFVTGYLDMEIERVEAAFAVIKQIISVLGLAGSIQVGAEAGWWGIHGSASFEPFQLLEPMDIYMDNLADMLMWMLGTVHVQKKLAAVALFLGFGLLVPVGCALALAVRRWSEKAYALGSSARRCMLVGIALALCIPLGTQVSIVVDRAFLTTDSHQLIDSLGKSKDKIKSISDQMLEVLERPKEKASLFSRFTDMFSKAKKVGSLVGPAKKELETAIAPTRQQFVQLLSMLGLTIFVMPPLLLLCLWFSLSWVWHACAPAGDAGDHQG